MQYAIFVVCIFQVSIFQQFCRSTDMMSLPLIVKLNLSVDLCDVHTINIYVKMNKRGTVCQSLVLIWFTGTRSEGSQVRRKQQTG